MGVYRVNQSRKIHKGQRLKRTNKGHTMKNCRTYIQPSKVTLLLVSDKRRFSHNFENIALSSAKQLCSFLSFLLLSSWTFMSLL